MVVVDTLSSGELADQGILITGPEESCFGISVADAGDLDGDGVAELAIGAWQDDSFLASAGSVYVYSGATLAPGDVRDADLTIHGDYEGSYTTKIGTSVDSAGDLDGDGLGDLIVGSASYFVDGVGYTGAVLVYLAPSSGTILLSDADHILAPPTTDLVAYTPRSLAGVGDTDGDGYDDFLAGAHQARPTGEMDEGRAYLVGGAQLSAWSGETSLSGAAWKLEGDTTLDEVGWAVHGPGDVDGDGKTDLLVAAPGADAVSNEGGEVYLFHGGVTGFSAPADADATVIGTGTYDMLGTSRTPATSPATA